MAQIDAQASGDLQYLPELSLGYQGDEHRLIEGDNLVVMRALLPEFEARFKMIYIDPPYNTGNAFIYRDRFRRSTDKASRPGSVHTHLQTLSENHSDWLSMMYPRLSLARRFLSDDGVIFVSIDEHEAHHLRCLLDEIFGPAHFVSNLIWRSRTSISNDHPISPNHTQTLIYAKNRKRLRLRGEPLDDTGYQNPDQDPRGPWKLVPLDANKPGGNTRYPIQNPKTGQEYWPPGQRIWAINPQRYQELLDDGRIMFGKKGNSAPKKKMFLSERLERGDTKTPSSLLLDAGTTKDGTTELMALFGGDKVFDYPKPTQLMTRLLEYGCTPGEPNWVMDFFSGSGSFAHACLQHPSLDLRCVAIQAAHRVDLETRHGRTAHTLGLNTIAEIGRERLKRVLSALPEDKKAKKGIRYYRYRSNA